MKLLLGIAAGAACLVIMAANQGYAYELNTPVTDSGTLVESLKILHDETDEDKDLHFWAAINRLNLTLSKNYLMGGIRYDTEAYFEKDQYRVKYLLEKAFVQYENHGLFLRGGDFYTNMGNGLLLSVLKRDEFGMDNTIRGGIAQYGDAGGYVELRALGGFINEGDDLSFKPERTEQEEPDFDEQDTVYGGQMELGKPGWGFLELRGLAGALQPNESIGAIDLEEEDPFQLFAVGGRWLNFGDHGSFRGEYAWYEIEDRKKDVDSIELEGRAAYGALNLDFYPVTFLFEGQDYYHFNFPYAEPPILEFEKQTFGHAPDREDIIGGRGYMEIFIPGIEVSVHGNYYRAARHERVPDELAGHYDATDEKDAEETGEWIEHSYGGVEKIFDGGAYVMAGGGYREEHEAPEGRWAHGEFDGGVPITSKHELTIEARYKDFYQTTGFFKGEQYGTWSASPAWNYSPYMSLTGRYEFSDEPAVASGVVGAGQTDEDDNDYWSGELTVHAGQHVDMKFFYGSVKGGLLCSGGVCQQVPAFEGLKADLTLRF